VLLAASCTSLVVSWPSPQHVKKVVGYAVYVAEAPHLSKAEGGGCCAAGNGWRPLEGAMRAGGTSFEVGGLTSGVDYGVAVMARSGGADGGWGPPSEVLEARTMAPTDFPRAIGMPTIEEHDGCDIVTLRLPVPPPLSEPHTLA
jgi:hypothetical protein